MSCNIIRNQEGQVINVLDKNGKESRLFKTIASHIAISDNETALSVYKNIYTDKFKDVSEDEMELSHRVGDVQYTSFKDALKVSKENQDISIGVNVDGKFTELLTVSKNTDLTTEIGFIQNGILNETIAENRLRVGNNYSLQAFGKSEDRKQASLSILREQDRHLIFDGTTFKIEKESIYYDKNGNKVEVELAKMSDEEIRSKLQNATEILAERELTKNYPPIRENSIAPPTATPIKEDTEVVRNLVSLLKKMGVSIVSMTNYVTNYTLRHGVNPNAEALADVANQVIAIVQGKESVENLLEETSHFILEAIPQEKLENILRNLPKSEEYKQHYQIQKAIYESEYSGEELENVVRKEILGKIVVNAILQSQETSETQQNFFENAKRLISEFFQNIVNYFKPEYQVELDGLLKDVENIIKSQDISSLDLNNFNNNSNRFYNVNFEEDDKIIKEALKNIGVLTKLEKDLSKTGKANALNIKELKKAQKDLEKQYDIHAIAKVVQVTDTTVKILEAALKDSRDNNRSYDLSQEENVAYNNLITEVRKGISILKELLDKKDIQTPIEKTLSDNISRTVSKIGELEAKKSVDYINVLVKNLRAVTTDRGLPEREFQSMLAWTIRAEKDINVVNKTFGTLNNASDALANIYATIKTNMTNRYSQKSHNETKGLQGLLKKFGKDEKYPATLVKDGYFISERNMPEYYKKRDENFEKAYNYEIKDNKLTLEELLKERIKGTLPWTDEQEYNILKAEQKANEAISERRMKDDYYAELEQKYVDLDISQETRDLLGALNSEKQKTRAKARGADKIEDLSRLSLQELELLKQLDKRRKQMKSAVEFDGELKTGLTFEKNAEGLTVIGLKGALTVDDLESDSRIAYDIFRLDNNGNILITDKIEKLKANENRTAEEEAELKKLTEYVRPKSFDTLILSKGTKEEQVDALLLNSNISFTSDFWDKSKDNKSLIDKLESVKTEDNEGDIEILILELQEISAKEKSLIKANATLNNPVETDVENMSSLSKKALKDLAELAETKREDAKKFTKDLEVENVINEDGVSESNEAWDNLLEDNGLSIIKASAENKLSTAFEIAKLAKDNATSKNSQTISDVESSVRLFRTGKTPHVSKTIERYLERMGMSKDDLQDEEKAANFIKSFAESRLLSYYRRYTPISYSEFKEDLASDMEMSEILNKNYEYLQITPNYSFNEEDTSRINPDYIVNSKMGYFQPKKSLYENKEIANKFGKITRDNNGYLESSERGDKEWEAYKAVTNFRLKQIDTMDGGANYNAYMRPQIRKQSIERWVSTVKGISGQSIKDAFENILTYTEDDQIQGDNTFGVNNKIIPRQYFNKLENQTDITEDVFNALILTNNAANLYESRVNYYGDFMAIQDISKNRQTIGATKETSATNRFKMLESAVDNDLFGIKQVATDTFLGQNTAKIVDSLGAFVRFKGLGGSIIIPATAYLTGKVKQRVERVIGQYYNKDSYSRGTKEYTKQLSKALGETGNLHSVAEMNVKGEYWQAFELSSRLYGSSFNLFQRFFSKASMLLYQAANYPIYAKNMYNVLHDFRIVDGKAIKFTDFQRSERTKDYKRTDAQIREDWAKENNVINNFHSANEDGQVVWDKVALAKVLTKDGQPYSEQELDEEILRIADDIRIQIKNLNVRSDMQLSHEDKVAANRHYLTNFLMAFKGFMIPLYEERFKNPTDKFNSQSRQMEQGSYVGIYELGKDIITDIRKNGASFMKAFQNQYNGDFTEQKAKIDALKAKTRTAEEDAELKILSEDLVRDMELVDLRHAHLKRLGVDMLFLNTLVAVMLILRHYADDDSEKSNYALQLAALMSQRLAGEVNTANLNLVSNYYDVASNPLQAFRVITDLSKLPAANKKGELGYTIAKNYFPFVNSFEQMRDPSKAADNMMYFSEVRGNSFWSSPLYMLMTEEK